MEQRDILFGLHELEGIGWKTIHTLSTRLRHWPDALCVGAAELLSLGLRPDAAERVTSGLNADFIARRRELYRQHSIGFVTFVDDEYPLLLKETAQPPWVLYYKGNPALINRPLLGIVGTRTPTAYGKKVAEDLACGLSRAGFGVVSGLARGIDSKAHIGGLRGPGSSIGVLGCAIDSVYPRENAALYAELAQKGLILSEYPIGTKMHPGLFPQRNRIIAGLSLGIVVVEAAKGSGSLITASVALDESRDVWAVPGPVTSPNSEAALALLKEGARLATCSGDLIEEYSGWLADAAAASSQEPSSQPELTAEERQIVDLLSYEPVTIDDLLERSQFTFGHLQSVLLSLLLTRTIKQLPGSSYILA
ncbi:DNA-protecting protein DprA [Paenibacillus athensensis]|uniref:DNA protecting protein DprA n=1 Tax=Paenibacillus athensensis TaxID=1967502 RepID=A0A4Y8Q9T3_9BACL|nr:DNA-processing protein DprA [Paenibacillus athensensis]MCD1257832.1 DNA-protecting protein DprA [Paenibacillus athensensis]